MQKIIRDFLKQNLKIIQIIINKKRWFDPLGEIPKKGINKACPMMQKIT